MKFAVRMFAALAVLGSLSQQAAWALAYGTPVARSQIGAGLVFVTSIRSPKFQVSKDCFKAKVWYGDHEVRKDRVLISMSGTQPLYALTVRSDETQDYPVATVEILAECGYNFTRTYTVFAYTEDRAVPNETSVGVGGATGSAAGAVRRTSAKATQGSTRTSKLGQEVKTRGQSRAQQRTLEDVCKTEDQQQTLADVCKANPAELSEVK